MNTLDIVKENLVAAEANAVDTAVVINAVRKNMVNDDYISMDGLYDDLVELVGEARGYNLYSIAVGQ